MADSFTQKLKNLFSRLTPQQKGELAVGLKMLDSNRNGTLEFDEIARAEQLFKQHEQEWVKGQDALLGKIRQAETVYFPCEKSARAPIDKYLGNSYDTLRGEDKAKAWGKVPKAEKKKSLDASWECWTAFSAVLKEANAANQGVKVSPWGGKVEFFPLPAYAKIDNVLDALYDGKQLTASMTPTDIADGVGWMHKEFMNSLVKPTVTSTVIAGVASIPLIGKMAIDSQIDPAIKELNATLKGMGAPVVATDYPSKTMDAAAKKRAEPRPVR